jgi:predicted Zn-dependent protease
MLASDDAPAECFYGLALNQIAMNDVEGAKQSLRRYRQADPNGVHGSDVERLASELDIVEALNRPVNRRLYRAMRVADHACDTLQSGDPARAKRLFERSLSLSSEQYEMRAMYALTLMMCGEGEDAVREATMVGRDFIRRLAKRPNARTLLARYLDESRSELCGDAPVLGRMKELLSYWCQEPEWSRLWPVVKICRSIPELRLACRLPE